MKNSTVRSFKVHILRFALGVRIRTHMRRNLRRYNLVLACSVHQNDLALVVPQYAGKRNHLKVMRETSSFSDLSPNSDCAGTFVSIFSAICGIQSVGDQWEASAEVIAVLTQLCARPSFGISFTGVLTGSGDHAFAFYQNWCCSLQLMRLLASYF